MAGSILKSALTSDVYRHICNMLRTGVSKKSLELIPHMRQSQSTSFRLLPNPRCLESFFNSTTKMALVVSVMQMVIIQYCHQSITLYPISLLSVIIKKYRFFELCRVIMWKWYSMWKWYLCLLQNLSTCLCAFSVLIYITIYSLFHLKKIFIIILVSILF